ncbi:hypothetical protein BGW36DRAFT_400054 [Talaromyces proteolyticus]|uniref:Rhodopsin domain-containing protein n=1 Tax=Talaromyces proteolyticus TaxID=1131652 RepID=A0AAD4PWQ9_9EURO|nr:uncharacterized protein BGW36DRAFT_400054 [Talaromyces proteolyticus]KAH8691904.1 hypothetical protein BGW36DRAFT_400054 [Talaromyces proteolyticus]
MEQQNKGPTILGVMWATTSTALVFVVARVYTRGKILKKMGLDDYLIGLSMILGLIFVGLTTSAVRYGNGRHSETLTRDQFEKAAMLNTAGFAPGILSFTVPKLGVVALLIRLFNPSRPRKIFLWSFVGGSCMIISGCIVIIYAQCSPTRALWTVNLNSARCWSPWILVNYSLFAGALSAFLDLFLAVYPGVIMWKLQIAQRKKIGLITAFSLGACAAVVAVYKCTRIPGLADESDSTYSTADLVIWTK